jgi:Uma2 family endonuclease
MSNAVRILPHYTYEDWLNWEGKWEIILGIPYAMSPFPLPKHQRIATAIGSELHVATRKCNNCATYQAIDYKISDDTILQPDILVICKDIEKNYLDFPPALVVEILSPSTALKDRHSKYQIYEEQKIKYYLIVAPDIEQVEVFEIENGIYQLKQVGRDFTYSFSLENNCLVTIDFKEIW